MRYSVQISHRLNALLQKTYEAKKRYVEAAEKISNARMHQFFLLRIFQLKDFAQALEMEIASFGQQPRIGGKLAHPMVRKWIDFSTLMSGPDLNALKKEVERGEHAAMDSYDDVLLDSGYVLPPHTESLLMWQRDTLRKTLETDLVGDPATLG